MSWLAQPGVLRSWCPMPNFPGWPAFVERHGSARSCFRPGETHTRDVLASTGFSAAEIGAIGLRTMFSQADDRPCSKRVPSLARRATKGNQAVSGLQAACCLFLTLFPCSIAQVAAAPLLLFTRCFWLFNPRLFYQAGSARMALRTTAVVSSTQPFLTTNKC